MKLYLFLLLIATLLASGAPGQDKPKRIGDIEFFGYAGYDINKIRGALPLHEGDEFNPDTGEEKVNQMREAVRDGVRQVTGHPPTDVSIVCCNQEGNLIIYIGLSGKRMRHNPQPKGIAKLPNTAMNLYERCLNGLTEAVQKGATTEDVSKGCALSEYPPLHAIQLEMRTYALNHNALLRNVLLTSSDDQQRVAAAHLLGYARRSKSQLTALAIATLDVNSAVRNNATRALFELATSSPRVTEMIPVERLVDLLLSGDWTDLNKASYVLSSITLSRKAGAMALLRKSEVRERLIEIARWRAGHAKPAQYILGRLAEIPEYLLERIIATGNVEEIIQQLHGK